MQTFSGMRRNSSNPDYIRLFLAVVVFGLLQILSNSFIFFPTFPAVFFVYIVLNIDNEEKLLYILFSFLYLSFYELNKGFYLFSSLIFFIIFYTVFVDKIRSSFTCKNCILAVYVLSFYLGEFFVNALISYILNREIPTFSTEYLYYMAFDFVVSVILFRNSV